MNIADIRKAQALISRDKRGAYLSGDFVEVQTAFLWSDEKTGINYQRIIQNLQRITTDLWNIGTLLTRIEWMRQYAVAHPEFVEMWRSFVSVDIEHFHIEYRSIFDYAASTLHVIVKNPKSIPQKSYRELYEWLLTKPKNEEERQKRAEQLGHPIADLITPTSWFMNFRDIRDSLVHRGSHPFVFGEPEDGTWFQIYGPSYFEAKVKGQVFMVNPNVADFELYSAYWLTHLLLFLGSSAKLTL